MLSKLTIELSIAPCLTENGVTATLSPLSTVIMEISLSLFSVNLK